MIITALFLLLAVHEQAPACQKQTIVAFFEATASGKGTIADLTRLITDQGELEAGLQECRLFPQNVGKPLTAEQVQRVAEVVRHPAENQSEVLAYLRYKWPKVFGRRISPSQVMEPVVEKGATTIGYPVRIDSQIVRFWFEEAICRILSIQLPDGRSVSGEKVECLWRHMAQKTPSGDAGSPRSPPDGGARR